MYNTRRDCRKKFQIESLEVRQMLAGNYLYSLTPRPGVVADGFGWSQAASDDYHVVGHPYMEEQPENGFVGEVQVHDADTGARLWTIANPDPDDLYRFGYSVDVYANWIVVGAVGWGEPPDGYAFRDGYSDRSGRAYLYEVSGGDLLLRHRLDGTFETGRPPSELYDQFGDSVSIDGNFVVVGAPGAQPVDTADDDAGHAYIFQVDTGALLHVLENPEPEASNGGLDFGFALTASDGKVVVSNPVTSGYGTGNDNVGKSYVYDLSSGNLLHTLTAPDVPDPIGNSLHGLVKMDGNVVAVSGSQGIGGPNFSEVIYVFDASTGALVQTLDANNLSDLSGNQIATRIETFGAPTTLGSIINAGTGSVTSVIDPPPGFDTGGGFYGSWLTLFGDRLLVGGIEASGPHEVLIYEIVSNEPPTDIALSDNMIAETPANGTIVGALTASDPDFGETFTFSLSDSAGGRFTVSGSNVIVADGSLLDYEANTSHFIEVMATDSGGNSITRPFTIIVLKTVYGTAGNDAFVLTYSSIQLTGVVNVTMSTGGGPVIDLGDIPMTAPLLVNGLGGSDSVVIRTTIGGDSMLVNGSGLTVNGATLFLQSIENRTLAAGAGDDQYLFDADVALGTYTLDEPVGGVDTIDFTATSTAVTLDLALTSVQVVNSNLSLRLTTPAGFEGARGGAGNDTLLGNAANNVLNGDAGHDTLNGRTGNDTYVFGTALILENDFVVELPNQGTDTLDFSALSIAVTLNLSTNFNQAAHTNRTVQLNQNATFENLIGGSGNDLLIGNGLANTLTGNAGNDSLRGLAGNDSHPGGTGHDVYILDGVPTTAETDTLIELPGEGLDTVNFASVSSSVTFSLATDTPQAAHANRMILLSSDSVFEHLIGGSADDILSGNDLANSILGGTGNDTLSGGGGNDELHAQQGDDTYVFESASSLENDFVVELPNQGTDTLDFSALSSSVELGLHTNTSQAAHTNRTVQLNQNATLEHLVGGSGNDTLTGNSLANVLTGNAGNDWLAGREGNDLLFGNEGNDSLLGDAGSDAFFGGVGDDVYYPGATPISAETENLIELPGEGSDTVYFFGVASSVTFSLATNTPQLADTNHTIQLNSGSTFEDLIGSSGDDILTGNDLDNMIFGGAGAGNDTLTGGGGSDDLRGQLGNDTYVFATASSLENDFVTELANQGTDTLDFSALSIGVTLSLYTNSIQSAHTDRTVQLNHFATFENLIGGTGNDILTGNSLANTLTGNAGNDSIFGREGNDQMFGNEDHDFLIGDAGSDSIFGGVGDDVYYPGSAPISAETDFLVELPGEGIDSVQFFYVIGTGTLYVTAPVTFSLAIDTAQVAYTNRMIQLNSGSTFENLGGGNGHDTLSGNDLDNTILGQGGNDTLTGSGGNDDLRGHHGNDTYNFATASSLEIDFIVELPAQGLDTLDFSALSIDVTLNLNTNSTQSAHTNRTVQLNQPATFENLIGGSGNDILTGNGLANTLTGNGGNDLLAGDSGNDLLLGNEGTDLLFGDANSDSLVGGLGDDVYYPGIAPISAETDNLVELPGEGSDIIFFADVINPVTFSLALNTAQLAHTNCTVQLNSGATFESLTGGQGNDLLSGNDLNNSIFGYAGNDTLNGGGGSDDLRGSQGNDTYVFSAAAVFENDFVVEFPGQGTDTLDFSSLSMGVTLGLNTNSIQPAHANRSVQLNQTAVFENLIGGSGDDNLTGNPQANILVGNDGNDAVQGSSGRDILIGGLGSDSLSGGPDDDILIAGRTLSDASLAQLIDLHTEWLSANSYPTRITNLRAGVGASLASLQAGINVLDDSAAIDTLTGNNGTDWYFRALDDVITDLFAGEIEDLL